MADPLTLGAIAVTTAGLSAYGTLQQGRLAAHTARLNADAMIASARNQQALLNMQAGLAGAEAGLSRYQAQIATNNATLQLQNAQVAREQAQSDVSRIRERNRRLQGRQIAVFSNAGVRLEGTPSDVSYDSAVQGELESLIALYTGDIEATKYQQESWNQLSEAAALRAQASMHLGRASILQTQGSFGISEANRAAYIERYVGDSQRRLSQFTAPISLVSNTFSTYGGLRLAFG